MFHNFSKERKIFYNNPFSFILKNLDVFQDLSHETHLFFIETFSVMILYIIKINLLNICVG